MRSVGFAPDSRNSRPNSYPSPHRPERPSFSGRLWFKRKNLIMKEFLIFHLRVELTFSFGSAPTEVNHSLG